MKLTLTAKYLLFGSAFFLALIAFFSFNFIHSAKASAPAGLGATIASSTLETVSTTATIVAATSTIDCAARIITTSGNSAVMLTFTQQNGDTPTGSNGVWQAASTTVAYDSGLYGCNAISAYSYSSQFVKVMVAH
jgi:hypothetical protein